jgi:hypothetical protein
MSLKPSGRFSLGTTRLDDAASSARHTALDASSRDMNNMEIMLFDLMAHSLFLHMHKLFDREQF